MARLDDASQALDIEVDQVAGMLVFIAQHRWRRVEGTKAVQSQAAQDAADGGSAEGQFSRNAPAIPAQMAQLFDPGDNRWTGLPRRTVRARRAIPQIGDSMLAIAACPVGGGPGAHVEAGRGQLQRASPTRTFLANCRSLLLFDTISFSDLVRMDNLLKLHS